MLGAVAVMAVAGLAVLGVQSENISSGNDRALRIAQYAAEGGMHSAAEYLSRTCSAVLGYTEVLAGRSLPSGWGNNVGRDSLCGGVTECSGEPWFSEDGNVGSETADGTGDDEGDNDAYFDVSFVNNAGDTGGAEVDTDQTVIVRSMGVGPGGAEAMILSTFRADTCSNTGTGGYAAEGVFGEVSGPTEMSSTALGTIDTGVAEISGLN